MPRKTTEQFINEAIKVHGDKYSYDKVEYIRGETPVLIYCKACKKYFKQTPDNHLQRRGCPTCANLRRGLARRKTTKDFIKQAKKLHKNKYSYDQVQYTNNYTPVKIYCNTCKRYFSQSPANHLQGQGCPYEATNIKLTKEEFIKKAQIIHGNGFDYSEAEYYSETVKIKIKCNRCGREFKQTPSHHLRGTGCPYCNVSRGEKAIQLYLDRHSIKYKHQHKFKECKDKRALPFDFYLPEYNSCIEYQGIQHYLPTQFNKAMSKLTMQKNLEEQRRRDQIKRDYCKKNNITLLEISYKDDIIPILEDFLKKFN